ncbi:MAG: ATPase, T2SS/T4P/T4SS family [Planctomycetaceae bacterium]
MDPSALGRLCVERGLLTESQLEECLRIQKEGKVWRRLGEVFLSEGLITGVALANLLNIQEAIRRGPAKRAEPHKPAPHHELGWLMREARACGALGVVLGAGAPPAFRFCGTARVLDGAPLQESQIRKMLAEAVPAELLERLERHGFAEDAVRIQEPDWVRVSLYKYTGGIGALLRPIEPAPRDLTALGLPAGARELMRARGGLILISGPACSGRTATLGALLQLGAASRTCHIVTLERPPEIRLDPGAARVTRMEVAREEGAYARALASARGADADIVALSELNSEDVILSAFDAAEGDCLVLAVTGGRGVVHTLQRLLERLGRRHRAHARFALASCLRGVLHQRLVPAGDGSENAIACELLLGSAPVAASLREDKLAQIPMALESARGEGMVTLDDSLLRLAKRGRISAETALRHAHDPERLAAALPARREANRAPH